MDEARDRELLRLLSGTTTPEEAEAIRAGLAGDAGEAARLAAWSAAWEALEPPPGRGVPPGFATAVMSRVRTEATGGATLAELPVWARAVAAAALAVGLVAGAAIGVLPSSPADSGDEVAALWSDPGPGESLWLVSEGRSTGGGDLLATEPVESGETGVTGDAR